MVTMSGWVFGLIIIAALLVGAISVIMISLLISGKQADKKHNDLIQKKQKIMR